MSLRPTWATQDPVSENNLEDNTYLSSRHGWGEKETEAPRSTGFSLRKTAWAWSQEVANECALMNRHLSHWWVNCRSTQVETELGMQGTLGGTQAK